MLSKRQIRSARKAQNRAINSSGARKAIISHSRVIDSSTLPNNINLATDNHSSLKVPPYYADVFEWEQTLENRTITAAAMCILGFALIIRYCPWDNCPFVSVVNGTYIASSISHCKCDYYANYQYNISGYSTTNCIMRDDQAYTTYELAEQLAPSSKYVNLTTLYYDTRADECINIPMGNLSVIMFILGAIVLTCDYVGMANWYTLVELRKCIR